MQRRFKLVDQQLSDKKDTLKVDILSETPVEEFKTDQDFDLILSIYGIEYSKVD